MAKKTVKDLKNFYGKRVLVRVDFNVPQDKDGKITNDRRIRLALPTIKTLLDGGAAVILMSHLGRPKGDPQKDAVFKMDRVGKRLSRLLGREPGPGDAEIEEDVFLDSRYSPLGRPVTKLDDVVGPKVEEAVQKMKQGDIVLLENLRFHPGEQKGDPAFAEQLAKLADVYVNDAFGTCHREDASMVAVPKAMKGKPRVVGLLVAKELDVLDKLLSAPGRPFVGILGGAKVSDKIGFIKALLGRVDKTLIGGAMTYTFMKAQGQGTGGSRVEADKLDMARELLELGKGKIILPVDHLVVQGLDKFDTAKVVEGAIPDGWIGVDIGPKTIAQYQHEIASGGTVVWNGPMGKFEDDPYSKGTRAGAQAMADSKATTIVGGGETAEAVEEFGLDTKMNHVSTGGGAFLEYVEGTPFAALAQIDDH